jgi:hypothetical protein
MYLPVAVLPTSTQLNGTYQPDFVSHAAAALVGTKARAVLAKNSAAIRVFFMINPRHLYWLIHCSY